MDENVDILRKFRPGETRSPFGLVVHGDIDFHLRESISRVGSIGIGCTHPQNAFSSKAARDPLVGDDALQKPIEEDIINNMEPFREIGVILRISDVPGRIFVEAVDASKLLFGGLCVDSAEVVD